VVRRSIVVAGVLLAAGCASIDLDYPHPESSAFRDYASTRLGRMFEASAAAHPGRSGVEYIRYGRVALAGRLALADLAERSLDLQYYIWDDDVSGRLLADRLARAAERGVRVRLLLDDISVVDRDAAIAHIAGHPNVSIRAFNPAHDRDRVGDALSNPMRLNRRSHNKIMVADNAVAIVGGRNIADHYFGVHEESNYRDLDAIAVGPVVRDVSAVFDAFWNSEYSVAYGAFIEEEATPESAAAQLEVMRSRMKDDVLPYPVHHDVAGAIDRLDSLGERLVWGDVRVLFDDPSKAEDKSVRGIAEQVIALIEGADREVLIENAYFVPRERSVEIVSSLTERGVRARVLTNSLASNDVVAVHSGYKKLRKELVEAGLELYELRPDSRMKERWSLLSWRSRSGLHTKAMVVDREVAMIGSYNFDPRSANINSECALLVESPVFAERVAEYLDEGVRPENAYRVTLEDGDLVWTAAVEGEEPLVFRHEPETSWWQRFTVGLMGLLPLQSQL
jgi:putative cardiolipin synthase